MRIALDATPLTVTTGGVRRYTSELTRALAETFPDDRVWLLSDQPFDHPAPKLPNIECGHGPRNVIERRWWLWGLQGELSRLGIEVFHGVDFAVPYLPVRPSVMTLHDLSPWLEPSWHAAADRIRTRTPLLLRLGLVNMTIVPSEAVRRQAMERFHLRPERVVTIPLAAPAHFRPAAQNGSHAGAQAPGGGMERDSNSTDLAAPGESVARESEGAYFLYVGTLEPRKNLDFLIDCWREVHKQRGIGLKLVGRRREDFREPAPEPGLQILGPLPDEQLPALFSGAIASVYPSQYEGFGLPVLEAMQCGSAVIASRDAAISETAGDAALQLEANDRRAWTEALNSAATEASWVVELREKGQKRASEFSWRKTASMTREVYVEAIRRFRRTHK